MGTHGSHARTVRGDLIGLVRFGGKTAFLSEVFCRCIHNKGMRRNDPKRTEAFLLGQDGVLDASVWYRNDRLQAHVTPVSHYAVCAVALREACVEGLGEAQAPESILVMPR